MPKVSFPHIPKVRLGFACPQPSIVLPLATTNGENFIRFYLDTGCAITHVPKPLADAIGIEYDEKLADEKDRPRTLTGRLTGYGGGELRTTFLFQELIIPCFVYVPASLKPQPPVQGPPGKRKRDRAIRSADSYFQEVERNEQADESTEDPPCLLGRLGFLNRFHVLIESNRTTVSTESFFFEKASWLQRCLGLFGKRGR